VHADVDDFSVSADNRAVPVNLSRLLDPDPVLVVELDNDGVTVRGRGRCVLRVCAAD